VCPRRGQLDELPPFDMFSIADLKMCKRETQTTRAEMEKNGNKTF